MKLKKLGRTEIAVSEICLGTMTWGRQNTQDEAFAQIEYALDQGINFMDTAELYAVPPTAETYGKTEEIIGNWFAQHGQRDKWVLASKIGGGRTRWIRDGKPPSADSIPQALEDSLRRLKTDYLDLYQIHWPWRDHYHFENTWDYSPDGGDRADVVDHIGEMLEALDQQVKAGKIRHIGVSNESAWGVMTYLRLAEKNGWPRIASIQNEYSLLRRLYDLDLAEVTAYEDVGLMAYSVLGAGVLSGKYLDGAMPPGTRGAISGGLYRHSQFTEPAIRCYVNLARDHGLDPNQMALAFALSRPFMTSVIIGATSMEQLKTDIGSANIDMSDEVMRGIAAIHRLYPNPI